MKGNDRFVFWLIILFAVAVTALFHEIIWDFDKMSQTIVFFLFMLGATIFLFAPLFSSPLKKVLYDAKNRVYETELHRIRSYYRFSIVLNAVAIQMLFLLPSEFAGFISLPMMFGSFFCLYKILERMFRIFLFPTVGC